MKQLNMSDISVGAVDYISAKLQRVDSNLAVYE